MGGVTRQYMTRLRFFKNVKSVDYRYPRYRISVAETPDFFNFFEVNKLIRSLTEV